MLETPETKKEFAEMFVGVSEYYQKKPMSPLALRLYWESLKHFEMEQVTWAISRHISSPEKSNFYPTAGDLIAILEGKRPSPSEVIAMARLADSPFGIMARIKIGTWDLNNQEHFYLADRANEVLVNYDEWKARALNGEYTPHEISIMLKHGVDPCKPFISSIAGPNIEACNKIQALTHQVKQTPRHKFLLEKVEEVEVDKKAVAHDAVYEHIALIQCSR